jgi:Tfp pilus assembly protein PilN
MPLHVNLYHEVQQQEIARQRDPVRLAMLAVLLVMIGFVVNYFIVLERSHMVSIRYTVLQGDWAAIEPKAKDAKARQDELEAEIAASDAMVKNVDSRLYWAPVLDQILQTVPRTVQLIHLGAEAPGDEKSINSILEISGISSAPEPRKEAENVRTALETKLGTKFKHVSSVFKTLDDSDQYVMLDGRRLPTAAFSMEFQVQVRDPVVVAPPPVLKARREAGGAE